MKLNSKIGVVIAGVVIILALGMTIIYNSFLKGDEVVDQGNTDNVADVIVSGDKTDMAAALPTLKNKAQFVNLIKTYQSQQTLMYGGRDGMMFEDKGADMSTDTVTTTADSATEATGSTNSGDFSGTNNQVVGVDEGDTLKTDGEYLYKIDGYGEGVSIVNADPDNMTVVSEITLPIDNYASQLFLSNGKLVVITSYYEYPDYEDGNTNDGIAYDMMWWGGASYTKTYIYNISDKSVPKLENEYQFKGNYVSGRTIGDVLYFVTNEYMYYDWYTIFEDGVDIEDQLVLPSYKDCTIDEEYTLDYRDIRYFPGAVEPSYMNTVAIDLSQLGLAPEFNAYLGSAYNIYVSTEALYTAVSEYTYDETAQDQWSYEVNTNIYKFDLEGTQVTPVNNTVVPGNIINQFSMDEYQGNFRIATTIESMWWDENDQSTNSLYI
ncbi:MAG: beta-propeller domain-containing protein, partial [Vallitaleaceae bacterium]|nr:beta-propeller domain-containing protein [Vallitaleaceae bacterium]